MDNVTFVTRTNIDGTEVEHAIIDKGDGRFISMTKENYDKEIAEQSQNKIKNAKSN
jgi:hypothetical protein